MNKYITSYVILMITLIIFFYFYITVDENNMIENEISLLSKWGILYIFIINTFFLSIALLLAPFGGISLLLPILFCRIYATSIAQFSFDFYNIFVYIVCSLFHGIFEFVMLYYIYRNSLCFLINTPKYVAKRYDFNNACAYYYKNIFIKQWFMIVILTIFSSIIEVLVSNRLLYFLIN